MSDPQTQTTRWEYRVSRVRTQDPSDLNYAASHACSYGQDGWELVSTTSDRFQEFTTLWFKRPRKW